MLLRFSFGNFRSFRDLQTLDLRAAERDTSLPENVVEAEDGTKCVRSAAIFGANAAGKSNVILAAHAAWTFLTYCVAAPQQASEGLVPFRLSETGRQRPCRFEFELAIGGHRYEYTFEASPGLVWTESLRGNPQGRTYTLFERSTDSDGTVTFDCSRKHDDLKRLLHRPRKDALVLTQAAAIDHEVLGLIHSALVQEFGALLLSGPRGAMALDFLVVAAAHGLSNGRVSRDWLLELLRDADLGIEDVEVTSEQPSAEMYRGHTGLPVETARMILEHLKDEISDEPVPVLRFRHAPAAPLFDLGDESEGTRRILALGPMFRWLYDRGGALLVDELSACLHPTLLAALLRLVHHPPSKAQLVFTTHDVTLLDPDTLRRDQVWLVEKGRDGASTLRPLLDFKPRKGEALMRGYLAGRYGAVPFVEELGS